MKKDINYIAALEKAIAEKYGDSTIINPKNSWDSEKEKNYLEQAKEKAKLESINEQTQQYIDLDGVLISKKLINNNNKRKCEYCGTYSFKRYDDLFFMKYDLCYKCYEQYIEGREERWKQGWRPKKVEQK